MRLVFSEKNREIPQKPELPKIESPVKKESIIKPKYTPISPKKYENDLDKAIKESLKDFDDLEEKDNDNNEFDDFNEELHKAIIESFIIPNNTNTISFPDTLNVSSDSDIDIDSDLDSDIIYSDDDYEYEEEVYEYDYGEKDFERAIKESTNDKCIKESDNNCTFPMLDIKSPIKIDNELKVKDIEDDFFDSDIECSDDTDKIFINKEEEINFEDEEISPDSPIEENSFHVCIDLRTYGKDPYQPVYIYGDEYFLRPKQIKRIQKIWKKIDPETFSGTKYIQDREYDKVLVSNWNKK